MTFADSHCHAWEVWPYSVDVPDSSTRGSIEQLMAELDAHHEERALVVCASIGPGDKIPRDNNEYVARDAAEHPNRISYVVDIDSDWSPGHHQARAFERIEALLAAYPHAAEISYPWVMGSSVSHTAGFRNHQPVSLGYRFAVAISRVLGSRANLLEWSDPARAIAAQMVATDIRTVILHGQSVVMASLKGVCIALKSRVANLTPGRFFSSTTVTASVRSSHGSSRGDGGPTPTYGVTGSDEIVTAASAKAVNAAVTFAWTSDADVAVHTPELS